MRTLPKGEDLKPIGAWLLVDGGKPADADFRTGRADSPRLDDLRGDDKPGCTQPTSGKVPPMLVNVASVSKVVPPVSCPETSAPAGICFTPNTDRGDSGHV